MIVWLIYVVLTFEFGRDITILKMAIFDKVDYIEIEPALPLGTASGGFRHLRLGMDCTSGSLYV